MEIARQSVTNKYTYRRLLQSSAISFHYYIRAESECLGLTSVSTAKVVRTRVMMKLRQADLSKVKIALVLEINLNVL